MKSIFFILSISLLGTSHTDIESISGTIVKHGIYIPAGKVKRYRDDKSPSGYSLKAKDGVELLQSTDRIPLVYELN